MRESVHHIGSPGNARLLRRARACAGVIAAALGFAHLTAPAMAAEPIEIKVGISQTVNTVLALWMAQDAGFYAAQGLKVEIVNMNGGSRGARELQAGHIDVMHVGLSSVVRLNQQGADLRTIASLSNVIRFTFFTAPSVRTAADLRGGAIAVSSFGSESDATVTLALARLGLTRQDVTLKEYGGSKRRLAAVKSAEVRATAVNEPVASLAREEGLNPMVNLAAENIPWLFSGLVVRREDIGRRRDALIRFLKASIEGNYLALTDVKRAKEVLAREARIGDPKVIDISYHDFQQQSPRDLMPSRAGAQNIIDQFQNLNSRSIDDFVDASLLDAIRQDGTFATLEQKYGKR